MYRVCVFQQEELKYIVIIWFFEFVGDKLVMDMFIISCLLYVYRYSYLQIKQDFSGYFVF